jgi:hypothetical protein
MRGLVKEFLTPSFRQALAKRPEASGKKAGGWLFVA